MSVRQRRIAEYEFSSWENNEFSIGGIIWDPQSTCAIINEEVWAWGDRIHSFIETYIKAHEKPKESPKSP
jgi:hypothetical protein